MDANLKFEERKNQPWPDAERFVRAFEDIGIGMLMLELDGAFRWANCAFCDLLGYTKQEILSKSFADITHPDDLDIGFDRLEKLVQGEIPSFEIEKRYIHKDGDVIWVELNSSIVLDAEGKPDHTICQIQDIRDRKKAERALIDVKNSLERQIESRTRELRQEITERKYTEKALVHAVEKAEAASHAKSQFLANMSHEFRTPLNAIIGFSDALSHGVRGPLNNSGQEGYVNNILVSGQHLLELVNNILDVTAIEANSLELREAEFSLADLAHSSCLLVTPLADQKGVRLANNIVDDAVLVYGDVLRIKQVLINLLTNSIKYTPPSGTVELDFAVLDDGDGQITVSDAGIGMDQEDIAKAMEKFGRVAHDHESELQGTGLGLPLSSGLVALHDGSLSIDSEPGKGTTVRVRLPKDRLRLIQNA
ncbi:MAG: PAS domain S-box protein [Rhodospirillales bacterium]|nr:PAS domain S-box protein [Rhodospirillales bacterium]